MECLYCEKTIAEESRSHKKFCNEKCKTAYHNDLKKEENEEIKEIKNALKRNWKILKDSLGDAKYKIVNKTDLLEEGFNFRYHTHHYTNPKGEEYLFSYNYGLREGRTPWEYMIVKSFKD